MKRVAVLASGGGSNLQAILDHLASLGTRAAAKVVLVASDRPQAGALAKARAAKVRTVVLRDSGPDSDEIIDLFAAHKVDLVALGGTRHVYGLNGLTEGEASPDRLAEALARAAAAGFEVR